MYRRFDSRGQTAKRQVDFYRRGILFLRSSLSLFLSDLITKLDLDGDSRS